MANLIGEVIDNYVFIELLGRGGMGTVYLASDVKLQRDVAIKILDESQITLNSTFLERFRREARNQAQLIHPNIVMVYGFLEHRDIIGIVMEYVKGDSVDRILRKQGRLAVQDAVHILKESLKGLGYAHSKGFIHRDIKPSNIMIEPHGAVKLMDFGISKSIFEKGITKTGANIGTAYYMSPEQIRAEELTHHTDIYSMGCTFYEIVTGEPPFNVETEYELFEHHMNKMPERIAKRFPDVPDEVDFIISKAMQKKYYERFNSCAEFGQALESVQYRVPEPIAAPQYERRKKKQGSSAGVVFVVLFLIFISALIYFIATHLDSLIKNNPFTK